MAKILIEGNEREVPDGSPIIPQCEQLGVTFGCQDGICGTCIVVVEEGMENLSEKNQAEIDMGLEANQRLACQCRINQGVVKLKY